MGTEIQQQMKLYWQDMLAAAQEALKDDSEDWTPDALMALYMIVDICQEQLKDKPE